MATVPTSIKRARLASSPKAKKKVKPAVQTDHHLVSSTKGKQKAKLSTKPASDLPTSFKVIAGSYEKLLYGFDGTVALNEAHDSYKFELRPIFIFPAHVSCIKAVAASPNGGKWLATGSADEVIKVWDLRRKKEIGGLMHHEGSITQLQFPSRSHLLSASEDGSLCLFHARDWVVLRTLKGHKGRVNSTAVHPSNKVALSVGKDNTLRMWDLMRGKGSASTKLGKEGEVVRWSTTGSSFVVQSQNTIDVFTVDMVLRHTITHPSRIHTIRFSKRVNGAGELLLVGAEDKKLSIYDIPDDPEKMPTVIAVMTGHSNRVKAVEILQLALPRSTKANTPSSTIIVCTVSSDGKIHVYDLASLPADVKSGSEVLHISPVAEYDTKGTRLTCVTIADGEALEHVSSANGKRKREDEDSEQEAEDEGWGAHEPEAEHEDSG
ncbi:WD40-repeat-containing domain protein [Suillus clintonianus]|uniref:WD40-repeat-containing domain protein n=1 Tax=Suillus clintonianus TaxID=1904413 RepID=UPI001B8622F0|nr:WD40-repeat-containing domain protein [Suillus clintonianus]KAG2141956.1 WD40-repeat-containing domain protein [Suillus clintonianus]